ncbi:hypothetical protein BDZ89DRAFT_66041 [Hymenopellis radicata]|nr:hypothetical protein BDZ89DRAFT_66041 [Hymenopellis radicata]
MAPLYQALRVEKTSAAAGWDASYNGGLDPEWTIMAVPHGGYVISHIIDACIHFQSGTLTPDPVHVTIHFLQSACVDKFDIHVRALKKGKMYTNLLAEFVQKGKVRITAHLMFGKLEPPKGSPSSYTRRLPLYQHPAAASVKPHEYPALTYGKHLDRTLDPEIAARNAPDAPNRTNEATHGGGGMEWGTWFTLKDKHERVTLSSLAVFADTLLNPPGHKLADFTNWFPTMVMTLEFKFPIPAAAAGRTVGAYSVSSALLAHPQNRHNTNVEIWSAPADVGEEGGEVREGWRGEQVCLLVASQMAMIMPMEVNRQRRVKDEAKL